MTAPFNQLTPAQAERLAKLAEEAGEIVQAAMKILRHGYDSFNPDDPDHEGNRAELERELGDLHAITGLMLERGDLHGVPLFGSEGAMRYMHHQADEHRREPENRLLYSLDSLDRDINRGRS
jgi:NTP pyrophosphatase (non-canonical NTP hydrolase)